MGSPFKSKQKGKEMISIYTSLYNLSNNLFNWQEALENFSSLADEVSIGTSAWCLDDTVEILKEYKKTNPKIKVVVTDFDFDNYAFDGLIKNAALGECTEPFCMLLDADERVRTKDREKFHKLCGILKESPSDAIFIPVIDLFNTERQYKSVGQKWYLSKNNPNIGRGIVNFAKLDNGKINHTASDTCELIYRHDNSLVKSEYLVHPGFIEDVKIEMIKRLNCPVIYHLGWLDKQKRIGQSSFWESVWSNRAGFKVDVIKTEEELNKIPYWEHGLPLWYD